MSVFRTLCARMFKESNVRAKFTGAIKWIGKRASKQIRLDYLLLFLSAASYVIVVSYFSVSNHLAFGSNAWDLGTYNQALYSALTRWKPFYHTVDLPGNPTGS